MKTGFEVPGGAALLPPVYLDASALLKLYVPEPESGALNRNLRGRKDLYVSDLAVTEIVSALARRRREGSLVAGAVARLHQALLEHLESGVFHRVEILAPVHREAERILLNLQEVPLRAADALHLALAISVGSKSVVTYDQGLAEAAQLVGLVVAPWPRQEPHPA